jgi:hypothetical protein
VQVAIADFERVDPSQNDGAVTWKMSAAGRARPPGRLAPSTPTSSNRAVDGEALLHGAEGVHRQECEDWLHRRTSTKNL